MLDAPAGNPRAGRTLVHSAVEHSAVLHAAETHVAGGGSVLLAGDARTWGAP